jgi:hypothetical protein
MKLNWIVILSVLIILNVNASTLCSTKNDTCKGITEFYNGSSSLKMGCTIFSDHGDGGANNFTVNPKETHEQFVQYGDMFCCVTRVDGSKPDDDCEKNYKDDVIKDE